MTARFERADHVQSVVMEGEQIIIHTGTGVVTQLNEVGSWVWEALERGAELEELVDSVLQRYEASRPEVVQDVALFLERLQQLKLVRSRSEA